LCNTVSDSAQLLVDLYLGICTLGAFILLCNYTTKENVYIF